MNREIEGRSLPAIYSNVHYLPCRIHYDGFAPVTSYFNPRRGDSESDSTTSSFRGRELKGLDLSLPADVRGLILDKSDVISGKLCCTGEFVKMTVWEHDVPPNMKDFEECFNWFEVSKAVRISSFLK